MLVNRKAYSTVCYKSIYTHVTYTLAYAWRKQRLETSPSVQPLRFSHICWFAIMFIGLSQMARARTGLSKSDPMRGTLPIAITFTTNNGSFQVLNNFNTQIISRDLFRMARQAPGNFGYALQFFRCFQP